MEQTNKLYEIVRPVRILEQRKSSKMKKGFIALAFVVVFFLGVGLVANSKGLDMNLPFEMNQVSVGPMMYPLGGNSISHTIINPNLMNPSFIAGDFKIEGIGYN